MTAPTTAPSWPIARRLTADHVIFAGLLAAVALLVAGAVTAGIAVSGRTPGSVWEQVSQLARWFAGGVGANVAYSSLPLHVTHGVTRRAFSRQAAVAGVAFVVALAALVTAGFALEGLVHDAAGWPQALSRPHLFATPSATGLVMVEYLLLYALWCTAGTLLGAGFYRDPGIGLLLVPVAVALAALAEAALGSGSLGPLTLPALVLDDAVVVAACATGCVVGLAATWVVVRDVPIRPAAA